MSGALDATSSRQPTRRRAKAATRKVTWTKPSELAHHQSRSARSRGRVATVLIRPSP
jgi:hypothetical protein